MTYDFGLIGAAGYIAPRHMKAIKETGNQLVLATDRTDNVGILDSYFPDASFYTEIERFEMELHRRQRVGKPVSYVSIMTPNYLHDAHIAMSLRAGSHAICEKPLVLNTEALDELRTLEDLHQKRIYTILQLRYHEAIKALQEKVASGPKDKIYDVDLTYMTSRGQWYHSSWKADEKKSGGLAANIGVHFYDMLIFIFGDIKQNVLHYRSEDRLCGWLELERARVRWFLSVNVDDIPQAVGAAGQRTYRSIQINGEELEFSSGFTDLHTITYKNILAGRGYGVEDIRPATQIVSDLRKMNVDPGRGDRHPTLKRLESL